MTTRAAVLVGLSWIFVLGATTGRADEGVTTTVGNRFSQTSSPLTNARGLFEAVFTHRFNQAAKDAGGGSLWGLDSGAAIGFGVDYVFVPNLAVQIYRVNTYADYEFALKGTLLRPTAALPLAVGARGGLDWRTASYAPKETSFFGQVLLSYTIVNRVTLAAAPSYAQNTQFQKDVFNVPLILQLKITKSIALMGEYVPKKDFVPGSVGQWSVALEKQVFNHRFALWMGNSQASTVDQYVGGDYGGGVTDRNMKIGFNLIRAWDLSPAD
jgi:hypothetical protein